MTSALSGMPDGGRPAGVGRSSFERVVDALEGATGAVKATRHLEAMARCPVHEDSTPSLSVRWVRGDRGGLVLLNCHGCGARAADVVPAVGLTMADLFDEPLPPREVAPATGRAGRSPSQRRSGQRRGRLGRLPALLRVNEQPAPPAPAHSWVTVETYPYVDAAGQLVQEVVRKECSACPKRHKVFKQVFVVDGSRVERKTDTFRPVLYRHPQVLQAVARGEPVYLLEGEKDVATAERLGLAATTNTQGGRAFPAELAEVLRGADVRVVLDRDNAGWDRGVGLHELLTGVEASVRLLLPVPTAAKSDLTDHVEAGHGVDDLMPVHVEEVAAWAALGHARRKHAGVEQALQQTQAQLEVADAAGRGKEVAQEHRRLARRWAVESEIRYEALRDLVDDVRRHVVKTGTAWAGEANERAVDLLAQGRTAARTAHQVSGIAVPPALQEVPAPVAGGAGRSGGGPGPNAAAQTGADEPEGGWGRHADQEQRAGATISSPTYRIDRGQIVQVQQAKGGKHDAEGSDGAESLNMVLGLDVQIVEMEYLEDRDSVDVEAPSLQGRAGLHEQAERNPPAPAELSAVTISYTDPASRERCLLRVPADEYKDCQWLESLPGPPGYESTPRGVAKVRDAIKAVSVDIRRVVRYRSTGWRELDGQWSYVHAQGAITADGVRTVPVLLTGPLARYDLPDPVVDADRLRAAFAEHSGGMLTRLPARVVAPLLGHVYRSAIGPNPWVLALIGSPGSYKTSLASLGMHHWGELWDRRKPGSSMSGNGDTLNALRIKLHCAKDALYWADDVAPTRDWTAAQKMLEEFARLVHNGEQRSRSTRDGQSVLEGTPPRSSAMITSEVMPRPGSGAQRLLVVPLQAEEIALEHLIALDAEDSRHARALLMSSMLRWLAGHLEQTRERCLNEADRYAEKMRDVGEGVRQAEAIGQIWAGWVCMTDFLVDLGAISTAEREQVMVQVDQGLHDAAEAAVDPDLPTRTGARVRELLAHALRTGIGYIEDVRTGEAPDWPLAGRLGWRRTAKGYDSVTGETRYQTESKGIRFGYLHDNRSAPGGCLELLVQSTSIDQVLKATGTAMADAPQLDRGTALRALHDEGVLIGEKRLNKPDRLTVQRTVHCEGLRTRLTALRLAELLGDDPAGGQDGRPPADDDGRGHGPQTDELGGGGPAADPDLEPTYDLFSPPPPVDGSQQEDLACAAPDQGLTSPQHEELPVSTPHADADGLEVVPVITSDSQPCLMCGRSCAVTFLELRLHVPCWWRSNARTRAAAQTPPSARTTGAPGDATTTSPTPTSTTLAAPTLAAPTSTAPTSTAAAAPAGGRQLSARPAAAPRPAAGRPPAGRTSAAGSGQAPARTSGAFAGPAAVLHTDGLWLPDGTRRDLPDPLRHVGHLAALVPQLNLGTQVTDWRVEPGQIWVTGEMLVALGVDVAAIPDDPAKRGDAMRELTRGSEFVTAAMAEGWELGGATKDCLGAWTRVWHGETRGVWVALVPAMNTDPGEIPVLAGDPSPATLARRLALFAGALRAPWAMSPGTTGFDLMITLRAKDRERLFAPREPVPPARINTLEQDLNWSRMPSGEELACRYVHAYDRGGSYAAGIAGLELGVGEAQHHPQGRAFDPKLPGYWRVEVPPSGDWRLPHPLNPRGPVPDRAVWVTTPTLQLALELGHVVPVLAAYVWPEHVRVLDPWYERVRDARTALDIDDIDAQASRDLLKVMYTRTIGMLGSEEYMRNRPGYAPDRRHHIVARSRANILRRISQIGRDSDRWPVAVTADTVLYLSDDPDPVTAWPGNSAHFGRGFGQFKPEASGLLADQLPHLNGRDYRGKEHLDSSWQPDAAAALEPGTRP